MTETAVNASWTRKEAGNARFLDDAALIESQRLRALLRLGGGRVPSRLAIRLARRWEGGPCYSRTWRRLLWERNGVEVGAYSYGALMELTPHPRKGLRIGRYVSMALTMRWGLNHPMDRISTSPMFYPGRYGYMFNVNEPSPTLEIGHDAWIGENAVVMPGCRRIGIGAVVGAGAIVTRDVPDFAIVTGMPATIRRYRFDEALREKILASRWWERDLAQLMPWQKQFTLAAESGAVAAALAEIAALARR